MTHPVTIRDILEGLESMEAWIRQLRGALASIDQGQRVDIKPRLVTAPRISGGLCPPPKPGPKKPTKKPPKKK